MKTKWCYSKMFLIYLIIYLINIKYCNCKYGSKIVGGKRADIREFPFLVNVALTNRENSFADCLCGATIVTRSWILTAAHCVYDDIDNFIPFRKYDLSVIAGSSKCYNIERYAQIIRIEKLIPHPKFEMSEMRGEVHFYNDIALMYLEDYLQFGHSVKPVALATKKVIQSKNLFSMNCEAIGWGMQHEEDKTGPPDLYKVQLPFLKNPTCISLLKNQNIRVLEGRVLCTLDPYSRKDVCQGDSGGPLICAGYQVGIVSGGIGCARKNMPNIWTRVDVYYQWIDSETRKSRLLKTRNKASNFIYNMKILTIVVFIYF